MKRIFFVQPLPYNSPDDFWNRTTGLLVTAFREMGYDAIFMVLHPANGLPVRDTRPSVVCSLEQMQDPAWWRELQPDAVVLYLWGAPRYDRIRQAALQATPRVIERLDTSGIRIPRIWPFYYFLIAWGLAQDDGHQNKWLSLVPSLLRTVAFLWLPSLMERPMALTLARLPCVVAESPLAAARTERHIRWHSDAPVRVVQISNPVDTRYMFYTPGQAKLDRVIAVGRWQSHQKDFPLLLASAAEFLRTHPDWSLDLVGGGVERHEALFARLPREISNRIHRHGRLSQAQVGDLNRQAKIHLLTSRWESFCVATIEALCCGCSYVGPGRLAGSSYLIENQSGTVAPRHHPMDLADALTAEAAAWRGGRRDPAFISAKWTAESGYREVAARTLGLLEAITEVPPQPFPSGPA